MQRSCTARSTNRSYLARSSTMPSLPLKIEATASAAVIRESTEVIAAGQERGINAPEIIPVALAPVIIEEQAEQVETVAYEVFNHGGHHGCARLIDSNGYTYYKQTASVWLCTLHGTSSKERRCNASLRQLSAGFLPGKHRHNHDPKVGKVRAQRIEALVKEEAHCNLLKPVSAIVNEVLQAQFGSTKPPRYLVKTKLVNMAKR